MTPQPLFHHLLALSDQRGLFEHAKYAIPRREHGYCVDDVARGLVVLARGEQSEPPPAAGDDALDDLAWGYLAFVAGSQDEQGRVVNRCDVAGVQHGGFGVEDCWGRALWGLGTTAARSRDPERARAALACFARSATQRSPHPRAMVFAGLGAAEVLRLYPDDIASRQLLRDTVDAVGTGSGDPAWPWPQPRLTYANAALPEVLIAAGDALGDEQLLASGLSMLRWLLAVETHEGHLSVTPVGGWGPGEPRPAFDQQPIEVAALADACARAATLSADPVWHEAVEACAAWFTGANDAAVSLYDPISGGCCDGLTAYGRNDNQGAESTLAMISTMLHVRRLDVVTA